MLVRDIVDVRFGRSRRVKTQDGLLRAPAVITRAGIVEYDAADMGVGARGTRVKLRRTVDSLRHPDTLASMQALPLTHDHPRGGKVTPENWRNVVVGSVGAPNVTDTGEVHAEILVGEPTAIAALDRYDQLSIGYDATVTKLTDAADGADYETVGPILMNHVGIVDEGRAGPTVRVADSTQGADMDQAEVQQMINTALSDALKGNSDTTLADKLTQALAPVMDKINTLISGQDAATQERNRAAAEAKAKTAATEFEARIVKRERDRFAILQDAARLLAPDKLAALADKSPKEIMVAALADKVTNAALQDEGFLRGALNVLATAAAAAGTPGAPGNTLPAVGADGFPATTPPAPGVLQSMGIVPPAAVPGLPAGVAPAALVPATGNDARDSAFEAYRKELSEAYLHNPAEGGGK